MTYIVTREYSPSVFDRTPTIKTGFKLIPGADNWEVRDRKNNRVATIPSEMAAKIGKRLEGDTVMLDIGQQIRKARQQRKMTQDELASKVRASRQYINMIEAGKSYISLEKIQQICDALEYQFTIKITRKYEKETQNETTTPLPAGIQ